MIEAIGTILGVLNVFLLTRRSMWNWPVGIAMTFLYTYIFFDAKLYSDTILQVFFTIVQLYGWYAWQRGVRDEGEVNVSLLSNAHRVLWAASAATLTLAAGYFFSTYTDAAYPYVDAAILGMSVAAQLLLNLKKVEAWVLWIAVDLVAIPLYAAKGLTFTTGLYVVFLGLAVFGLVQWVRRYRKQEQDFAAAVQL